MPSLVFYRTFETKVNVYDGKADKDAFNTWMKPLMVPTVFPFTEDEIEAVFGQQQKTVILFRSEDDDSAPFMDVFKQAAEKYKGKMLFSYAGSANQIQAKLKEFMGVEDSDQPTLRAILPENMKKYRSELNVKDMTVD